MDPDSANEYFPYKLLEQATSQIVKTAFLTVAFSAVYYDEPESTVVVTKVKISEKDNTTVVVFNGGTSKKKKKTIYLTFDDGPNRGTKNMMHIVQQEAIPVTLFVVGEHVYGSIEQRAVFDSIVKCPYFEIANHSFTHAFNNRFVKFYALPDSALHDFKRCADSLQLTANIIRTPGRNIWRTGLIKSTDIQSSAVTADSLFANGFSEIGWDLEWHYDDKLKLKNTCEEMLFQVDSMFAFAKTKTLDHLILLAHDQVYEDAADSAQLQRFIGRLKAKNEYNFETVSRYPGIKN